MKIHHIKNIMELLRTYLESEVIDAEEYFYVADHSGFRYFKIKKNEYLVFLFKNLRNGICREILFERAQNEGLDTDNLNIILEGLMKKDIVEEAFFPEEIIDFEFEKSEIPELLFSRRFGLEIGWLSNFESQDRNRFQMFNNLKNSKIAIVGAGGLGANIAVLAAATGVGKVLIVDGDIVEESNLVRQLFYKETDCGKTKKVDALRRFLNEFSAYTDVETVDTFIHCKEDADQCLNGVDVVIQTADTPRGEINRIVNDFCVAREVAAIYCSNGTVGPFYVPGISACYHCFERYLEKDSKGIYDILVKNLRNSDSRVAPSIVMGPWLMASFLFGEVFQYLIGTDKMRTLNRFIRISDFGFDVKITSFERSHSCNCYSERKKNDTGKTVYSPHAEWKEK